MRADPIEQNNLDVEEARGRRGSRAEYRDRGAAPPSGAQQAIDAREPASTTPDGTPVFQETIAGSLIDSARISVMASLALLPAYQRIVLPGDENLPPNVHECLEAAMQWLDAARIQTIERSPSAPTSFHVIQP